MKNLGRLLTFVLLAAVLGWPQSQINSFQILRLGKQSNAPANPPINASYVYFDGTNVVCVTSSGASCLASSGGSGTVTSIATTSPITGGTITTTGTIACATCVVASSPGTGVAHFAGSTQTVTSSLIVAADITSGTITGTQISSSAALPNGVTATTQSSGDNSTKVATTAYVDRAPAIGKWLCGNNSAGAGATWTCVSRANVASGDVLIAACSGFLNDAGAATTTVADTLTTTWTRIGSEYFESSPQTYHLTAFKGTAASSGADTITCTSTNAATAFTGSFLATVVGTSAVDVAPTGNSGTNGHADSTQLTTTAANDLCFQWEAGSTITVGGGTTTLVYNGSSVGMAAQRTGTAGNYVLTTEVASNFGNFSFCLK